MLFSSCYIIHSLAPAGITGKVTLKSVMRKSMVFLVIYIVGSQSLCAQKRPLNDTNYFVSYRDDLIGRIYMSEKYTHVDLKRTDGGTTLKYRPNSKLGLGLGFTYRPLTLNIAYGWGFLNPDTKKGE